MRTTKQLSITFPLAMAEALTERVAAGDYASESEVIRDGLRALFARDEAVEAWLRSEVTASYDELRADRTGAISSADLRAHLSALHARQATERQEWTGESSTHPAPSTSSPSSTSGSPTNQASRTAPTTSPPRSSTTATASRMHRCSGEPETICDLGYEPRLSPPCRCIRGAR
ncbi:type II toxin-antitoxin system ParD family antitoxin [Klenkia sp. PcliD-1-E]|nr:type II toxin-antitoxin system ParD family antitoxin [Klenkia sp. PcliD-1-E]MCO7219242.1 type II toxin-antitoxin system ParD family antitoxin [Klenkia sp. PcliD-1-E]